MGTFSLSPYRKEKSTELDEKDLTQFIEMLT